MKIAFVQCRILPGGATSVLKDIIDHTDFDEARIFTLISKRKYLQTHNKKVEIIQLLPSRISKQMIYSMEKQIPILKKILDYRNFMPFFPLITKLISQKIKKYNPEIVYISSFVFSKNIEIGDTKKILYIHSPMQYIRENYEEYKNKFTGITQKIFIFCSGYLRKRDKKNHTFEKVFSNSVYTQTITKKLYGIESTVLYPKIAKEYNTISLPKETGTYYITIGRIVKFVRELDKVIHLFNENKQQLIIVGDGPDFNELKKIAKPNIQFLGGIDDELKKIGLLTNAKGYINIAKESFGIATIEALSCGLPVFGYAQGGTLELVDINSGLLVTSKDQKSLKIGFEKFLKSNFDRKLIKQSIQKKITNYSNRKNFK